MKKEPMNAADKALKHEINFLHNQISIISNIDVVKSNHENVGYTTMLCTDGTCSVLLNQRELHIKKNDTVIVLAGEDKGKTGKVLKVLVEKNRAIVEGVNLVSKSTKPSAKNPQGGIVKQEASIHISNLSLIDPKSGKATRIAIKKTDDGKKVRIAKKSGEEIK